MDAVARAFLDLTSRGAVLDGSTFIIGDQQRVRVINGMTKPLSKIKSEWLRVPPQQAPEDIIVCAGAVDDGNAQPNIVREQGDPNIVRTAWSARWVTRVADCV
jgi:hypothetical protein